MASSLRASNASTLSGGGPLGQGRRHSTNSDDTLLAAGGPVQRAEALGKMATSMSPVTSNKSASAGPTRSAKASPRQPTQSPTPSEARRKGPLSSLNQNMEARRSRISESNRERSSSQSTDRGKLGIGPLLSHRSPKQGGRLGTGPGTGPGTRRSSGAASTAAPASSAASASGSANVAGPAGPTNATDAASASASATVATGSASRRLANGSANSGNAGSRGASATATAALSRGSALGATTTATTAGGRGGGGGGGGGGVVAFGSTRSRPQASFASTHSESYSATSRSSSFNARATASSAARSVDRATSRASSFTSAFTAKRVGSFTGIGNNGGFRSARSSKSPGSPRSRVQHPQRLDEERSGRGFLEGVGEISRGSIHDLPNDFEDIPEPEPTRNDSNDNNNNISNSNSAHAAPVNVATSGHSDLTATFASTSFAASGEGMFLSAPLTSSLEHSLAKQEEESGALSTDPIVSVSTVVAPAGLMDPSGKVTPGYSIQVTPQIHPPPPSTATALAGTQAASPRSPMRYYSANCPSSATSSVQAAPSPPQDQRNAAGEPAKSVSCRMGDLQVTTTVSRVRPAGTSPRESPVVCGSRASPAFLSSYREVPSSPPSVIAPSARIVGSAPSSPLPLTPPTSIRASPASSVGPVIWPVAAAANAAVPSTASVVGGAAVPTAAAAGAAGATGVAGGANAAAGGAGGGGGGGGANAIAAPATINASTFLRSPPYGTRMTMPAAAGPQTRLPEWQPLQATTVIGRAHDGEGPRTEVATVAQAPVVAGQPAPATLSQTPQPRSQSPPAAMPSPRAETTPLPKAYLGTPSNVLTAKAASTAAAAAAAAMAGQSGGPAGASRQASAPNARTSQPPWPPMPTLSQPEDESGGPASYVAPISSVVTPRTATTYGATPVSPRLLGPATTAVVQIGRLSSATSPPGSLQMGPGSARGHPAGYPGAAAAQPAPAPVAVAVATGGTAGVTPRVSIAPTNVSACTPPMPSARRIESPIRYAPSFHTAPGTHSTFVVRDGVPYTSNINNNNNNNANASPDGNNNNNSNNNTNSTNTVVANPVYYRSVTPPAVSGGHVTVAQQPIRFASAAEAAHQTHCPPHVVHRLSSMPGPGRPIQVVTTGTAPAGCGPVARIIPTAGLMDPRFASRTPVLLSRQTIITPVDDSSPKELRGSSMLISGGFQAGDSLNGGDSRGLSEDMMDSKDFSYTSRRSPAKDFVYHDHPLGGSFAPPELELLRQAEADLRYTPQAEVEKHFRDSLRVIDSDTPGRRNSGTLQNSVDMMDKKSSTPSRRPGVSTRVEL